MDNKKINECIKLMEKITGKKVILKENTKNLKEYYDTDEEDDITFEGDEDFLEDENENASITAILDYIKDYNFDIDKSNQFNTDETVVKQSRKDCINNISKNFDINWKEVTDENKIAISNAIDQRINSFKK